MELISWAEPFRRSSTIGESPTLLAEVAAIESATPDVESVAGGYGKEETRTPNSQSEFYAATNRGSHLSHWVTISRRTTRPSKKDE